MNFDQIKGSFTSELSQILGPITLPSPYFIGATVIFSILGYLALRSGKKENQMSSKVIGWTLMIYPILVDDTLSMVLIGVVLCIAFYAFPRYIR